MSDRVRHEEYAARLQGINDTAAVHREYERCLADVGRALIELRGPGRPHTAMVNGDQLRDLGELVDDLQVAAVAWGRAYAVEVWDRPAGSLLARMRQLGEQVAAMAPPFPAFRPAERPAEPRSQVGEGDGYHHQEDWEGGPVGARHSHHEYDRWPAEDAHFPGSDGMPYGPPWQAEPLPELARAGWATDQAPTVAAGQEHIVPAWQTHAEQGIGPPDR